MAKATVKPPAPPDVQGMRDAEKKALADMQPEEGSEETSIEEIRRHLHDALDSTSTALNLLDDLEASG